MGERVQSSTISRSRGVSRGVCRPGPHVPMVVSRVMSRQKAGRLGRGSVASLPRGWPAACRIAALTLAGAAVMGCDVNSALERQSESRRIAADVLVQFTKAAEATNRAVMADTDEASVAFAGEAQQAKAGHPGGTPTALASAAPGPGLRGRKPACWRQFVPPVRRLPRGRPHASSSWPWRTPTSRRNGWLIRSGPGGGRRVRGRPRRRLPRRGGATQGQVARPWRSSSHGGGGRRARFRCSRRGTSPTRTTP